MQTGRWLFRPWAISHSTHHGDTPKRLVHRGTTDTPTDRPTAGRGEVKATNPNRSARPRPVVGLKATPHSARRPQHSGRGGSQARRQTGPCSSAGPTRPPPPRSWGTTSARARDTAWDPPALARLREATCPKPGPTSGCRRRRRSPQEGGPAPRPPRPHPSIPPRCARRCHGR